jgi:hypothetical protein
MAPIALEQLGQPPDFTAGISAAPEQFATLAGFFLFPSFEEALLH